MTTGVSPATTTTNATTFGERLRAATDAFGPLCAGIDPHRALVESWGLTYDVDGLDPLHRDLRRGVRRPRRGGQAAVGVLRGASARAAWRSSSAPSSRCARPGRSSSSTPSEATSAPPWLRTPRPTWPTDAVAPADALTVSPYLGFESLRPALDLAAAHRSGRLRPRPDVQPGGAQVSSTRGCATSASPSPWCKGAAGGERRGARAGRARQRRPGRRCDGRHRPCRSSGSTWPPRTGRCWRPGVGAQGGTPEDLRRVFGDALPNVLPASSREVLVGRTRRRAALREPGACAPATTWPPSCAEVDRPGCTQDRRRGAVRALSHLDRKPRATVARVQ